MSLNENEELLLEAIKSMLQDDAKLGLTVHDKDKKEDEYQAERGLEYLHGNINEMFRLKAAELDHSDAVNQAFNKVHSYKYVDDPTFSTAFEKELVAQAVPANERAEAAIFISKIIDELKEDNEEWAEKDFGFNPNIEELKNISQPEQPLDFEVHDMDGYNDENVDFESGDASMGVTPSDE